MAMTGHTTPSSISQVDSTLFTITYGYQRSLSVAVWRSTSWHHSMSFGSFSRHLHTVLSVLLVMRVSFFLITCIYHTIRFCVRIKLIDVTFAILPIVSFLILSPGFSSSPKIIFISGICKPPLCLMAIGSTG